MVVSTTSPTQLIPKLTAYSDHPLQASDKALPHQLCPTANLYNFSLVPMPGSHPRILHLPFHLRHRHANGSPLLPHQPLTHPLTSPLLDLTTPKTPYAPCAGDLSTITHLLGLEFRPSGPCQVLPGEGICGQAHCSTHGAFGCREDKGLLTCW